MEKREMEAETDHSVKGQVVDFYKDFKDAAERETHDPPDTSQGDQVVRKHANGVAVTVFALIGLFLLVVLAGYAIHTYL